MIRKPARMEKKRYSLDELRAFGAAAPTTTAPEFENGIQFDISRSTAADMGDAQWGHRSLPAGERKPQDAGETKEAAAGGAPAGAGEGQWGRSGGGGGSGGAPAAGGADGGNWARKPTAKGWKPPSVEGDEVAVLLKAVRSLLNKLTKEKFGSLSVKLMNVETDTLSKFAVLVTAVHEKALQEPKFAEMYADLCVTLSGNTGKYQERFLRSNENAAGVFHWASETGVSREEVGNIPSTGGPFATEGECMSDALGKTSFKKLLLLRTQKEFENASRYADIEAAGEAAAAAAGAGGSQEEREAIALARIRRTNERRRIKQRMLGNVRFLGALYTRGMVRPWIIGECLEQLQGDVTKPDQESIEALVSFWEMIGQSYEGQPGNEESLNKYFQILNKLSSGKPAAKLGDPAGDALPARVRFLIKDVIETRSNGWVARSRGQMQAKTMDEIRADWAKENPDQNAQ
jgi:translation initiation factor 4G